MTKKVFNLLDLTSQLSDFKKKKDDLHRLLIDTNRAKKRGEATQQQCDDIKKQIAEIQAAMRSLEHDISILTVEMCQATIIEETPYGRVIRHSQENP